MEKTKFFSEHKQVLYERLRQFREKNGNDFFTILSRGALYGMEMRSEFETNAFPQIGFVITHHDAHFEGYSVRGVEYAFHPLFSKPETSIPYAPAVINHYDWPLGRIDNVGLPWTYFLFFDDSSLSKLHNNIDFGALNATGRDSVRRFSRSEE